MCDRAPFGERIGDLYSQHRLPLSDACLQSADTDGSLASSSQTFTTGSSSLPVVNNGSVLNATGTTATFKAGSPRWAGTINLGSTNFTATRYPNLKLWLDANDSSTIFTGLTYGTGSASPSNNTSSVRGGTKGTEHHAEVYQTANGNRPKYYSADMNSKPTVKFDGNDRLIVKNGRSDFQGWDKACPFSWSMRIGEPPPTGEGCLAVANRTAVDGVFSGEAPLKPLSGSLVPPLPMTPRSTAPEPAFTLSPCLMTELPEPLP